MVRTEGVEGDKYIEGDGTSLSSITRTTVGDVSEPSTISIAT